MCGAMPPFIGIRPLILACFPTQLCCPGWNCSPIRATRSPPGPILDGRRSCFQTLQLQQSTKRYSTWQVFLARRPAHPQLRSPSLTLRTSKLCTTKTLYCLARLSRNRCLRNGRAACHSISRRESCSSTTGRNPRDSCIPNGRSVAPIAINWRA